MSRIVKYTSEAPVDVCNEKLPGCDLKSGTVHVCFEDGSGITVCTNCFNSRLNEGEWITDSCVTLKAA
ncbi:MAG: hypothetical protein WC828_00010 [Thermoleophilia bacterium]|jgi:hypothetical protein